MHSNFDRFEISSARFIVRVCTRDISAVSRLSNLLVTTMSSILVTMSNYRLNSRGMSPSSFFELQLSSFLFPLMIYSPYALVPSAQTVIIAL